MSKMPSEKPVLMPGERLDDLQRDGLRIIQNPSWFCFGMDAVLLSWFARGRGRAGMSWIWDAAMA